MKTLNYFCLAVSSLGMLFIFALIIYWGISLPDTAVLWVNGPIAGWFQLLIFAAFSCAFCLLPCIMSIDELRNNK